MILNSIETKEDSSHLAEGNLHVINSHLVVMLSVIYLVIWFLPLSLCLSILAVSSSVYLFSSVVPYSYPICCLILLAVTLCPLFSGVVPTFILPIESSYWLCHLSIYLMVWFLPLSYPSPYLTGCHPLSIYLVVWFYPYPTHRIILLAVSPSVQLFSSVVLPLSHPSNHPTGCATLCPVI